ncbi:MAG: hypothetical protein DDG59_13645 [Anaerolineae bacterium]|nr:MAG: hypothetical protein DDG59_13645 [Anaerolineae bacterium]
MKIRWTQICVSIALVFSLVGCSSKEAAQTQDHADPVQRGKALYEMNMIGDNKAPGCIVCHSLEPGKNLVGPSLAGIATYAQSAVAGMTAADFLRQAIVEPDKHLMEGYPAGVMYQNYGKDLPEEDINALVAFLLTLK